MSQQQTPIFSVVLTTYNRAWCIERAIVSVFAQTEQSWELIIVDDGSTDEIIDVVRPYIGRSDHVRLILQTNQGTGAARQAGIQLARGHFVTFLDSDDEYLPDHLLTRKAYITNNPDYDFFHGGVLVEGDPYVPDRNDPSKLIHIAECAVGGTFVVRRTLALQLGFAPLRYGDDADFFDRARAIGIHPFRVPAATYRYNRTSPDSLCTQMARRTGAIR
ncbi:MAG: glycosyltransferase family 2 protein [Chlorobi bacterium]|nr:glycosyltransferase family 2 protein [Chlorobiota bacterium]